jgi:hypothetical protein
MEALIMRGYLHPTFLVAGSEFWQAVHLQSPETIETSGCALHGQGEISSLQTRFPVLIILFV